MANHSSEILDSYKYGDWSRTCLDCHDQHGHNHNPGSGNLVEVVASSRLVKVDYFDTLNLDSVNVLDPAWADPSTWGSKTGPERGLIMEYTQRGNIISFVIVSATADTITVRNGKNARFPYGETMYIRYGMHIAEEVNGQTVNFSGPATMAFNETGADIDTTPDGICQVCHTQTTYWRSDGSRTDHFNGWRCMICHVHEKGFMAETPEGCICPEGETCNE